MSKPKILDTFCCQGGSGRGYDLAGFRVVGIDREPQPRYPYTFHLRDALDFIHVHGKRFDAIHASPPCQRYSNAQRIRGNEHPDLIGPLREALIATGRPYVIENVENARRELVNPVMLCGPMFGLHTYRHRLFESNVPIVVPPHPEHAAKTVKMGRPLKEGDFYHAVGNFTNVDYVRRDMDVGWMTRDGIRECIPPAYTEFIGRQLIESLNETRAA